MATLICNESGSKTKLNDTDDETVDAGIDRIIKRERPGHFGISETNHLQRRYERVEVCCSAGDLTEHTGEFLTFRIEP